MSAAIQVQGARTVGMTVGLALNVLFFQLVIFSNAMRGNTSWDLPIACVVVDIFYFGTLIYVGVWRQIHVRQVTLEAGVLSLVKGKRRREIPVSEVREIRHFETRREAFVKFRDKRFMRALVGPNVEAFVTELSAQSGVPITRVPAWKLSNLWGRSPRQS